MNTLLDTNACISLLNGRPPQVREHLIRAWTGGDSVFLSTIVLYELFYGAAKSSRPAGNRESIRKLLEESFELLEFDLDAAKAAGEIRADLERKGTRIGECDTLIAAQALVTEMVLVTANTREFERVDGLNIEDWTKST